MITKRFVEKIRYYFNELQIDARNGISYDEFFCESVKSINRAKMFDDALAATYVFYQCQTCWKKIEKIFKKRMDLWQSYAKEKPYQIKYVKEKNAYGVYYVTNAFEGKQRKIFATGVSFGDEISVADYDEKKFHFDNGTDFYMKYARRFSKGMKLFHKKEGFVCNIVFSRSWDVFLDNNYSRYDIKVLEDDEQNTFMAVFDHFNFKIAHKGMIDCSDMIAEIRWDTIDLKKDLGLARVELYREVEDISPILYFAASTFLLFKAYKEELKRQKEFREACQCSIMMAAIMHRH